MKRLLFILAMTTFGGADGYTWASLVLVPICSAISWFAGRRARNNDTMQKMQDTINMLSAKNDELYKKIIAQNDQIMELNRKLGIVRDENAELKAGQAKMIKKIAVVSKENAGLKQQLNEIQKSQSESKK